MSKPSEILEQALIAGDDYAGSEAFDGAPLSRAAPSSGAGAIDSFTVDAGTYPTDDREQSLHTPPADGFSVDESARSQSIDEAVQDLELLLWFPEVSAELHDEHRQASRRSKQAPQARAEGFKKPEAYSAPEVRSDCRSVRAAAARHLGISHALRLTHAELVHLHSALSHDRNRTRKAIGKGLAEYGDLHASDSVWEKLQGLYFGLVLRRRS